MQFPGFVNKASILGMSQQESLAYREERKPSEAIEKCDLLNSEVGI